MYLLDTNIMIEIIRKNRWMAQKLNQTIALGISVFSITLVYYEVQRGIVYTQATGQARRLTAVLQNVTILGVDSFQLLNKAAEAEVYSDRRKKGQTVEDVDIFVMAAALLHNLTVVTNDQDFLRAAAFISNLKIQQWP
ncbi:DUF4411 family protein [Candidatus Poribacteria bacterium]|nr:DUF4411 family protein [Candidatus Poribacteria bacterium]